jgi:hypothetical protein
VKVIAGFVGASSLLGLTYVFLGNTTAMVIVAAGIVLVMSLLFVYKAVLNWARKRRANPLSQSLAGNAAAAPQGISEPARRARLDDLRRNFEQGVEKFRAAGKNLYSVPWYVLVGEPGSGKTEAIRHCNVGFPPGLQDQLQGAGGTLNMNWWFTNQAIILDTAGRLMFEEVAPGTTNEWQEFLKLLKTNRPNCPINGMLLVIPVDTLIKDSADQIEKKAGKIAQQFDQIQRTLGVRFPVFVIITKCDLLNGFREFFDDLNDPQLQHQIMGWSNPAPLDEKFDPAAVTNHLEAVKGRLINRRSHLLLDPVNTEDPQARRVDQVDALYALPDSLTKIAPRLRRYLEMIFVAGEWSPKPLFLRGIYFTSSMTEGSALDAELAEVLGVPVDSLPEGRVWRRDRAYFLRDLFLEKVFREKGLVTRASNADKQQRTRRAVVLACGIVAVLVLFVLTWLGYRQLESSIGKERRYWVSADDNIRDLKLMQIIDADANNKYFGEPSLKVEGQSEKLTPARFFGNYLDLAKTDVRIPVLFKPMAFISGDVNSQRRETYRALYESTMLAPVYSAARKRVGTLADSWSPDATAALQQLLKLEYAAATGKAPDDAHPQTELDPLFKLVLSPEDYARYQQADAADLQKVLDWVYTDAAGGSRAWPPKVLAAGTPEARAAINQGIDATLAYWRRQTGDKGESLAAVLKMRQALAEYQKSEALLLALRNRPIDNIEQYNAYREVWTSALRGLRAAHDEAVKAWAAATKGKTDADSVRKLYEAEIARLSGDAQKTYEALLKYTPEAPASTDANAKPSESYQTLTAARTTLQGAITELKSWASGEAARNTLAELSAFDTAYLAMIKGTDANMHHRFEVQMQLYDLADKKLVSAGEDQASDSLEKALVAVDKDYGDTLRLFGQMSMVAGGPEDRLTQTLALSQFTVEVSARAKKFLLADSTLKAMTTDPDKWPDAVAERAKTAPKESLVRPALPLVTFPEPTFSPRFSPDAAGLFADALETVRKVTTASDSPSKILDAATLASNAANIKKGFDTYKDAYVHYWKDQTKEDIRFTFKNFAEFSDALVNVTDAGITAALGEYTKKVTAALARLGTSVEPAPGLVREECRNALGNWTNLGNDPRVARRTILALDTASFREGYIVVSSKGSDSIAGRYWQGLPLEALRVLANDGQQEINNGLVELARFERFPLAAPGDRKDDLSLADVLAARTALEKVRGAGAGVSITPVNASNPGGNPQSRTIGQGGVTRDSQVDGILDRLRGTNLLRDKQEYFSKLEKFFTALPSENKPLTCTLSIAKDKLKEDNSIAYRYSYVGMAQNNKDLKEGALISTVADTVTLEYPGGDLAFKFREEPGGPIRLTESLPGNWAVLRLLKSDKAKTVTRDGNKWTVEYLVTDSNKKTYSLWLVLEFKAPLPDLKDWPVPPAKQ